MSVITSVIVKTLRLMDEVLSWYASVSAVGEIGNASCGYTYTIYNVQLTGCYMNLTQEIWTFWDRLWLLTNPVVGLMAWVVSFAPQSPVELPAP